MASNFKMEKIKLYLLTNINMLLLVEKGISDGICYSNYRYVKANNRYSHSNSRRHSANADMIAT